MKVETKLIAGVLALVGLGAAVVVARGNAEKEIQAHIDAEPTSLPAVKVSKEDADKLTKFVIKNKDKGEVTLEKKGDTWELSKPLSAAANQANVKSLIDNIQKFELQAQIASTVEPYKKYELDEAQAVHVQAFAGADKKLEMFFGKSGSRGQMARVAGTDGVFTIKGYSSYLWGREVKNWRDSEILKFEDKNAVAVEITNKNGKFSFTKDGESWKSAHYKRDDEGALKKKASEWEEFEASKVKDMLGALKNLKATDFADAKATTGVDKPEENGGLIRIVMKDDPATHILKVGSAQEGSNRYLAKEGNATVYVINSWPAKWALAERKEFEKDPEGEGPKPGGMPGGMPGMPGGMPGMPGGMPSMPPGH